ncbi:NAD(P)H-hydrate epimerase [Aeromicrobium sp. CTD01-1L150]|uniref:NAD(P)H-hydrate epimerase n=1 Tax=Aeromicrobium sp. CTD01-1L150 TaxID=3341830 RepID=UPI0035C06189
MLHAHAVADVRGAEERLAAEMAAKGLPEGELMQRAARGLADALADVPAGEVLLVLAGPGNNGGDALYAAAHLLDRGVRVDVCPLDPATIHEGGLAAARAAGARVVDAPDGHRWVLDGILGIGARPGLRGAAAHWVEWISEHRPYVVAVDVPSGVDVDTGTTPGPHIVAHRTVTFGTHKVATLVGPAADACGETTLVDIGLTPHLGAPAVSALQDDDRQVLASSAPGAASHKYTRGVVGVAAGSQVYAGAAHLCVAGAQSGLAGMVRFLGSDALTARVVDRAPEVVAAGPPGDRGRVQTWVVGPGAGDDVDELLRLTLADDVAVVVDAGALEHLPVPLAVPALLTPHAGELARMLEVERSSVEAAPLTHARLAADRWQACVLLKGARTVVVSPETGGHRRAFVNQSGTPWLATAGAGDVLAGLAGSLIAGGLPPLEAGALAAFLHGRAAEAVNPGGPVTASAVARELPAAVARLLDEDEIS